MLLVTRYLLPDTCYLTHVTGTCYLVYSPAICYLILVKPDTSYLILASRYIFSDNLYLIPLTVYLLPNTYDLIFVTWYLLPIPCYTNLLTTTFFWTLVKRNITLDSFYIMITTNYMLQMLYTGKYIPYFLIRIKLPDIRLYCS